jgi:hypothetical protein
MRTPWYPLMDLLCPLTLAHFCLWPCSKWLKRGLGLPSKRRRGLATIRIAARLLTKDEERRIAAKRGEATGAIASRP